MFFVDFLLLKMLHDKDKLKVVTSHYTSDKIGGVYLSAQNKWQKKCVNGESRNLIGSTFSA